MLLNDYYIKMQEYSISQLRANPDYLLFCKCIGNDYNNLQKVSKYLLDMVNIDKAEGKYLDYIGWLVGTTRTYFNIARFFSVNSNDLNVMKYFWFPNQTIGQTASLPDELFRRRIYAKIGYNTTKGTREDNIYIIKNMTFADKVLIKSPNSKTDSTDPMCLEVTLIGNNILQTNTLLDDIENILGTGVGLVKLHLPSIDPAPESTNTTKWRTTNGQTNEADELAA
nr:MAG TPA: Protein of unknown function (DUF2612) [Caudoviricetes sp.]